MEKIWKTVWVRVKHIHHHCLPKSKFVCFLVVPSGGGSSRPSLWGSGHKWGCGFTSRGLSRLITDIVWQTIVLWIESMEHGWAPTTGWRAGGLMIVFDFLVRCLQSRHWFWGGSKWCCCCCCWRVPDDEWTLRRRWPWSWWWWPIFRFTREYQRLFEIG